MQAVGTIALKQRSGSASYHVLKQRSGSALKTPTLLFPDRIKREKGVWWMPWQQEAMKDVVHCDKPWGAVNRP